MPSNFNSSNNKATILGVATATTINKLTLTQPATGATLTLADGKTFAVSNTLTFTGTDSSSVAFGAGGTVLYSGGALSVASLTATGAIVSSGTAGVGYTAGAGGAVTQLTSKSTGVTLNKASGTITMNNAALAAANTVTFVLTNSTIAVTDTVTVSIAGGEATDASYQILPVKVAAGSCKITVWNITNGSLSEALVLQYNVHKGANT
jgi:hypothetical protein